MKNLIKTLDGSNTLYSNKYKQNFHDIKTGAIQEALSKHVLYHSLHTRAKIKYKCRVL